MKIKTFKPTPAVLSVWACTARSIILVGTAACSLSAYCASVAKLEDHSLPKSKVKTYHVTCTDKRFGMVRLDTTVVPNTVCSLVQDGSRPESCTAIDGGMVDARISTAASKLCE